MKITSKRKLLQLLRTVLDTLPDYVYIKDVESRFLFANDAVYRSMGVKNSDELIGKTDFDFHPQELAQQYYADEQELFSSGQALINREEPVKDQETGEMGWFLTNKIPFRNRRGNIVGFVGINRDITQRKQIEEELARRMRERTETLESLQHLMRQISHIAQQLGGTSETMIEISSQMAAEAEQSSRQISLVSSNSQQISQYATTVSVSIEQFAANIRETSRAIEHVAEIVDTVVQRASAANGAMKELESHSQEIGNISKMITAIAQQTRFLALNATIEAARAGDAGQGFKVVAAEVKDLARETSGSAEDIEHKIEQIQTGSRETASAMAEVLSSINRVSSISAEFASGMSEQTQHTTDISQTVSDVAQGSQGITLAITELADASKGSAKRAAHVQTEAQELASLAEQLRRLMEELDVETELEKMNDTTQE